MSRGLSETRLCGGTDTYLMRKGGSFTKMEEVQGRVETIPLGSLGGKVTLPGGPGRNFFPSQFRRSRHEVSKTRVETVTELVQKQQLQTKNLCPITGQWIDLSRGSID